ncbi:hypothetical protein K458DRAFT_383356 [Lentithecium fluviatile CBS 122367]|uniref:Velvet domain-containing protein n=1 Tax=Lentithecium fluviatile CBS 122367 TaxID=1168545 RepID=A0A6G1JJA8_9PLEO|nr:hypothetical protein K458DRAFT_383356 [Lentithecium fluviatile CBS 122367]
MYGSHAHTPTHHPAPLYQQQPLSSLPSGPTTTSGDVKLVMRQQPKEALQCIDGKEKMRKPVDPPPVVQLQIGTRADPHGHFLQSPYLFMCAALWHPHVDEPWKSAPQKALAGSLVSSLNRLKDINNKDGAFFVFGDISVKIRGHFRLRFCLFEYQKTANGVQYLGSILSDRFQVDTLKEFRGLQESTYLSRAFSDQGVRLRLRKEPRTMIGGKRTYNAIAPPMEEGPNKRLREEEEGQQDGVSYPPALPSTYNTTPSLPSAYTMPSSAPSTYGLPQLPSTYSMPPDMLSSQQMPQQQWPTQQQQYNWYGTYDHTPQG